MWLLLVRAQDYIYIVPQCRSFVELKGARGKPYVPRTQFLVCVVEGRRVKEGPYIKDGDGMGMGWGWDGGGMGMGWGSDGDMIRCGRLLFCKTIIKHQPQQ